MMPRYARSKPTCGSGEEGRVKVGNPHGTHRRHFELLYNYYVLSRRNLGIYSYTFRNADIESRKAHLVQFSWFEFDSKLSFFAGWCCAGEMSHLRTYLKNGGHIQNEKKVKIEEWLRLRIRCVGWMSKRNKWLQKKKKKKRVAVASRVETAVV